MYGMYVGKYGERRSTLVVAMSLIFCLCMSEMHRERLAIHNCLNKKLKMKQNKTKNSLYKLLCINYPNKIVMGMVVSDSILPPIHHQTETTKGRLSPLFILIYSNIQQNLWYSSFESDWLLYLRPSSLCFYHTLEFCCVYCFFGSSFMSSSTSFSSMKFLFKICQALSGHSY